MFYYLSKCDSPNVLFMIVLLGRKVDAQKYLIDFELKKDFRKIKFIELCYSDAENIQDLLNEQHCISIPKKVVNSYLVDNEIPFRFIIKRKETMQAEESEQEAHLQQLLTSSRILTVDEVDRRYNRGNNGHNSLHGRTNSKYQQPPTTSNKNSTPKFNSKVNYYYHCKK